MKGISPEIISIYKIMFGLKYKENIKIRVIKKPNNMYVIIFNHTDTGSIDYIWLNPANYKLPEPVFDPVRIYC